MASSLTIPSQEALTAAILAYFRVSFPTKDLGDESWLGEQAKAIALTLLGFYQAADNAGSDAVPSESTSSARLDELMAMFGLSNGAGGYGRKGAIAATGGIGPATGTNGTLITAGHVLIDSTGAVLFATTADGTTSSGTVSLTINATTTGTAGNLAAGAVLTFQSPPAGINPTITLATGLTGGTAQESDADGLARLFLRLQNPPKGGTSPDWRAWAEGVTGIDRAYIYPRRNGTGTVDAVCVQAGSGVSRPATGPSATPGTQLAAVLAAFASYRLVAVEGCRAIAPDVTGTSLCTLVLRVVPATGYGFDWDSSGGFTKTAYTAGPPATLTLSGATPVDITGMRLQIISASGAWVLPQIVTVTAYNTGTHVATLQNPLPTGWIVPTNGDIVHSGGATVTPVATAVLAMVDALGPSKYSGYADQGDGEWDDTLRIDQIIATALGTYSDYPEEVGSLLVRDFVTDPLVNGAATNVQAGDSGTPHLLIVKSISVAP